MAPWEKVLSLIVVETLLGQFVCYLGVVLDRCVPVWMVPRVSVLTLQIAISRSTWILKINFLISCILFLFFLNLILKAKFRIDNFASLRRFVCPSPLLSLKRSLVTYSDLYTLCPIVPRYTRSIGRTRVTLSAKLLTIQMGV